MDNEWVKLLDRLREQAKTMTQPVQVPEVDEQLPLFEVEEVTDAPQGAKEDLVWEDTGTWAEEHLMAQGKALEHACRVEELIEHRVSHAYVEEGAGEIKETMKLAHMWAHVARALEG